MSALSTILASSLLGLLLWAQVGDRPGEKQHPPSKEWVVPAAPVLPPKDAVATITLPPGFRIELVAAEPLVSDPVAIAFDPDGRLWVVEMPGYNREFVDALPFYLPDGEKKPVVPDGKVVRLDDTNGDGRLDRRVVFLSGLRLPRTVGFAAGGVLVGDPPQLWLCRDRDGDGRADEKELIAEDFGDPVDAESSANGLLWGRDNWIHNTMYGVMLRYRNQTWERRPVPLRGQWGITQDDEGRFFYTRNSDQMRGDLFSPHYALRNPAFSEFAGVNIEVAKDQRVWPIRPTPGVNRGYRQDFLRSDGTLAEFTAAAASVVYRGNNFPSQYYGNAFIPEPAAHLVKRSLLLEQNGVIEAVNAYDRTEFLRSTDERFRPVFLSNGPDGALYVVDFYRGILEGYNFITTFLRDQILERRLNEPLWGHGRIYRIVHEGSVLNPAPAMSRATTGDLVGYLTHRSGWWRDTAQQVLVERGDRSASEALRNMAFNDPRAQPRLHALWTLEGFGLADEAVILRALADGDSGIRAAAIRMAERLMNRGSAALWDRLNAMADDPEPRVQIQLALSLGEASSPRKQHIWFELLRRCDHPFIVDAILTGVGGQETAFLREVLQDGLAAVGRFHGERLLAALSAIIIRTGEAREADWVIASAGGANESPAWVRRALANGVERALLSSAGRGRASPASRVSPERLEPMVRSKDPQVSALTMRLVSRLEENRKEEIASNVATALTPAQQELVASGKIGYLVCAACHKADGQGLEGRAPPLVGSSYVLGPKELLIRIALFGKEGAAGYPAMPPLGAMNDAQIAGILTYIRRAWRDQASPVSPEEVGAVRKEEATRIDAWTNDELEALRTKLRR
jgi:mono/diheme cytochrome c family protein/glucose/arabinose dehydrogenase